MEYIFSIQKLILEITIIINLNYIIDSAIFFFIVINNVILFFQDFKCPFSIVL